MSYLIAKVGTGHAEVSGEDLGGGEVALKTTATISGGITIGEVDVAKCEDDAQKSTPYANEAVADISVDKHGRTWTLPQDLETAIMEAGDVSTDFAYVGTTEKIDYILYTSARWNSLLSISKRVREAFTYDTSDRVTNISRTIENIP